MSVLVSLLNEEVLFPIPVKSSGHNDDEMASQIVYRYSWCNYKYMQIFQPAWSMIVVIKLIFAGFVLNM